ncbi:MAG: hypothetical protein H6838_13315 [Planctomycetes bacterium]|nr:hypothetical protein [Planctomycetota bacterium]MCB9886469.1 hypothetical protein [Planctomycetota bacterium]
MKTTAPFVVACSLAGMLGAQTPPCFSTNDLSTSVSNAIYSYSSAAPNTYAWQITPASSLAIQGLEVFTGNNYTSQVGTYMTLEIWDENASTGTPGTRLAGGTWIIDPTIGWQGASLDSVALLTANTNYWVVFTEPGWSTPPIEPGGAALTSMRLSGGAWAAAGTTALKSRLYCGLLDQANVVPFGTLCASSSNSIGTMFTNQPPTVGNAAFRVEGTGFAPGSVAFLVIGMIPQFPSIPIPGTASCFQSTDAMFTVVGTTGTGNVRAATASGHTSFGIPLPSSPAFQGFYFAPQLAVLDPGSAASIPFVTSNALQLTVY